MNDKSSKTDLKSDSKTDKKLTLGLIMPISEIDGCSVSHWLDVKNVITEVAKSLDLHCDLVSNANQDTIIHQTIVTNLYTHDVVVCDVSCKNPNVMFELGMRLAFDKPTIVIKDTETSYNFDTSPIRHITYPRDLRYSSILSFKDELKQKLVATLEAIKTGDSKANSFLTAFGPISSVTIEEKKVSGMEFLFDKMSKIEELLYDRPKKDKVLDKAIIQETYFRTKNGKLLSDKQLLEMLIPIFKKFVESHREMEYRSQPSIDDIIAFTDWLVATDNQILDLITADRAGEFFKKHYNVIKYLN